MKFKVIKLTAEMGSQLVISSDLHLDGLLYAVHPAMHDLNRPTRYDPDGSTVKVAPLPLLQAKVGRNWVWVCSVSEFDRTAQLSNVTFTKRRDPTDVYSLARQFQPASGPMKDRMERHLSVLTPTVSFYAATTDPSELKRIVHRVRSIGGLRKEGYGKVTAWGFEELEGGWAQCLVWEGAARRRLPLSMIEVSASLMRIEHLAVRPPYWHRADMVPAVEPGTACKLREDVVIA